MGTRIRDFNQESERRKPELVKVLQHESSSDPLKAVTRSFDAPRKLGKV